VVVVACQLVRLTFLARYLGPMEYGHWGFAAALVALFGPAADLGLSTIAIRNLARGQESRVFMGAAFQLKAASTAVLVVAIALVGALASGGVPWAVTCFLGAQMVTASFGLLLQSLFRSSERMTLDATVTIVSAVMGVAVTAALVTAGAGVEVLAAGFFASTLAAVLVALAIASQGLLPRSLVWDSGAARKLLMETLPLGIGMMATAIYYFFDRVLMGALGQDVQVGWYTAAYMPVLLIANGVGVIRTAFLPAQSRAFASSDGPASLLRSYGRLSLTLSLPVGILGVVLARPLLLAVYGDAYEPATLALRLLFGTCAVMFLSSFFGSNLLAADRQSAYLRGVALGALVNVGLNAFMVPLWSLNGAAVGTLASESAVAISLAFMCRKWLGLDDLRSVAAKPVLAGLLMAAVVAVAMSFAGFIAAAIAGALVYGLACTRLGLMPTLARGMLLQQPAEAA